MSHYIGLDVSMKETSICIVTEKGKIVYQATEQTNPSLLAKHIQDCNLVIRSLSKCHLFAKIALFDIFSAKFFDHVYSYALKILQKICTKSANFFKQSEF